MNFSSNSYSALLLEIKTLQQENLWYLIMIGVISLVGMYYCLFSPYFSDISTS